MVVLAQGKLANQILQQLCLGGQLLAGGGGLLSGGDPALFSLDDHLGLVVEEVYILIGDGKADTGVHLRSVVGIDL